MHAGERNVTNLELARAGFVGQPESELDVAFLLGLAQEHLLLAVIVRLMRREVV
jgi:hypothetical protein